jgi:Sec-independent protein translocase protein TatA
MFSLGGSEILVLAFVALLLFGNKNLPQNMKKMVKGLNEVKKVANDAQRSWHEIRDDVSRQIMADEASEKARKELQELREAVDGNPHLLNGHGQEAQGEHSLSDEQARHEAIAASPPPLTIGRDGPLEQSDPSDHAELVGPIAPIPSIGPHTSDDGKLS